MTKKFTFCQFFPHCVNFWACNNFFYFYFLHFKSLFYFLFFLSAWQFFDEIGLLNLTAHTWHYLLKRPGFKRANPFTILWPNMKVSCKWWFKTFSTLPGITFRWGNNESFIYLDNKICVNRCRIQKPLGEPLYSFKTDMASVSTETGWTVTASFLSLLIIVNKKMYFFCTDLKLCALEHDRVCHTLEKASLKVSRSAKCFITSWWTQLQHL